jgi:hypothetical protein
MTIPQAFTELLKSDEFKAMAKVTSTYRSYKTRFNNNTLSLNTQIELLEANGYVVKVDKVEKK